MNYDIVIYNKDKMKDRQKPLIEIIQNVLYSCLTILHYDESSSMRELCSHI